MRKLTALILACMLLTAPAFAAKWAPGCGPEKPYEGSVEVDLSAVFGHILKFPQAKFPVEHFCDVLEIYTPREDVALGEGTLRLFDENGEVTSVSFADPDAVELRKLEESELNGLIWGSGMCVEIHLPVSLKLNGYYYVTMDKGCMTAADGAVQSPMVDDRDLKDSKGNIVKGWQPVVTGEWGISGLYYSAPAEAAEGENAPEDAPVEYKTKPEVGDTITFDVVLGGEAVAAVIFSENGSVKFDTPEYEESATAVGTVIGEDVDWGVVFLDEDGQVIMDGDDPVGQIRLGQ